MQVGNVQGTGRSKYPFASMSVGTGFVVSDPRQFSRIRMAASRWNKEHGTNIKCNVLASGNLQVYLPGTGTIELAPTKFQFTSWLASLVIGMRYSIAPDQTQRSFAELEAWIEQFVESQLVEIECKIEEGRLTIMRLA